MAFWTALVQDGCDYAKLRGGNVELIARSDVLPFLEVGVSQYRAPLYYPTENEWKMVFTEKCQDYPADQPDMFRTIARWLQFSSMVLGGGFTMFLWFSTCFTFSKRTWRFCAFEALMAAMFRGGSFLFLFGKTCTGNATSCELSFGSRMDIIGIVMWVITSLVMFGHYAEPRLRSLTLSEFEDLEAEEEEDLAPRPLSTNPVATYRGHAQLIGQTRRPGASQPGYGDGTGAAGQYYTSSYDDEQSYAAQSYYDDGKSIGSKSYFTAQFDDETYA